jgi:predicted TIM-barrel fold metal-dependent hydrolase
VTRTVDVWMQHPTQRFLRQDIFASLRRWTGDAIPQAEIPIDATVAAMDGAGVAFGLLSAWSAPAGRFPISNEEVAGWEAAPTDRRYYPLYAACVELGVPFCTQVGHTGPLKPSETGRPIPYIDQVAIDFPELTIVCGHIGYPWTEEMVAVARKHERVFIDTSAYTSARIPPELVRYMQSRGGRHKVLFGTNWPMIAPDRALADLDALGLDDETRALYLGANAQRGFALA